MEGPVRFVHLTGHPSRNKKRMAKRKAAPVAAGDGNKSSSAKKSKAEQLAAARKWADEKKSTSVTAATRTSRNGPAISTNQRGSAAKARAAASSCETGPCTEGGKGGSSFLKAARENGQAANGDGSSKKSVPKPKTTETTDEVNENEESKHVKESERKVTSKIPLKYIMSLLILLAMNVGAACFVHSNQSQLDRFRSQCEAEMEKLHIQLKQREEARSVIETGTGHVLDKDRLKEGTLEQIRFAGKIYGLMVTKMDELNEQEKAEWLSTIHNLEDLYTRSRKKLEQHRDPLIGFKT